MQIACDMQVKMCSEMHLFLNVHRTQLLVEQSWALLRTYRQLARVTCWNTSQRTIKVHAWCLLQREALITKNYPDLLTNILAVLAHRMRVKFRHRAGFCYIFLDTFVLLHCSR